MFFKPKSRKLRCEIIADLYQTRHAESNGAIGDFSIDWELGVFGNFQEIFSAFQENLSPEARPKDGSGMVG